MHIFAVACVYLGFALATVGIVTVAHPLGWLGVSSRARGAALVAAGAALVAAGWALPAPEVRVARAQSRIDEYVPIYQFAEVHATRVAAPPAVVYRALREVTASEIRGFGALTWLRRAGRPGPESILRAPAQQPLLDVATRTTFLTLAEVPERELVVGTLVLAPRGVPRPTTAGAFQALDRPGVAKAAMNFELRSDGRGGTRLTTTTRVYATDARARRRFARYWRVIYPGSAIIRRQWLAAVRRRAERAPLSTPALAPAR